jgi:phage tail-like protein
MYAAQVGGIRRGRGGRITRRGLIVGGLALVAAAAVGPRVALAASDLTPDTGASQFVLRRNDKTIGTFRELVGSSSEMVPSENLMADGGTTAHTKRLDSAKPSTVTLRGPADGNQRLLLWRKRFVAGEPSAIHDVQLVVEDAAGATVKTYTLVNAFPRKVEIGEMKADDTEGAIQTVTLQADKIVAD